METAIFMVLPYGWTMIPHKNCHVLAMPTLQQLGLGATWGHWARLDLGNHGIFRDNLLLILPCNLAQAHVCPGESFVFSKFGSNILREVASKSCSLRAILSGDPGQVAKYWTLCFARKQQTNQFNQEKCGGKTWCRVAERLANMLLDS